MGQPSETRSTEPLAPASRGGGKPRLSLGATIAILVLAVAYVQFGPALGRKLGVQLPGLEYELDERPAVAAGADHDTGETSDTGDTGDTGETSDTGKTNADTRAPNPEPRAPNPEPRAPNPEPRAPNPEPRAPNPEPRAPNPEPRAPNPEPRAPNPEPRAPNPEPRAPNPEPRASNPEPRAPNPEPRARTTPAPAFQRLGRLTDGARGTKISTAGLEYRRGGAEGHRLDHVMRHAEDDLTRPVHGVFDGDQASILAVIDEAYLKAKQGGAGVKTEQQEGRTVYTVDLGRQIGYIGGREGERRGNPPIRKVRLVLEGVSVISAYPLER